MFSENQGKRFNRDPSSRFSVDPLEQPSNGRLTSDPGFDRLETVSRSSAANRDLNLDYYFCIIEGFAK